MIKMRNQLSEREDLGMLDVITYGCSAHILNLLGKDIDAGFERWSKKNNEGKFLQLGLLREIN